jgi:hypothetical protein
MTINPTTVGLIREQFRRHGHATLSMDIAMQVLDAAERGLERSDSHVVLTKADRPPPRLVRLTAEHGRR